jgi:hypothetical protein
MAVDDVLPPLLGQVHGAPKGIDRLVHRRNSSGRRGYQCPQGT